MYLSLAFVAAFFSVVHATVDLNLHQWQARGASDLRSPCPGLNTLANHGFLPRDGRNITVEMVLNAALEGFNIDKSVLILVAATGLLTAKTLGSFTLDDLKLHGIIEHDASLSRSDFCLGDNLHFNETVYSTLAESNPGVDYFNATSAGQVQKKRLADDTLANPCITNTIKERTIRTGESALYLSVMGDPMTSDAPKKFVNVFFREERMPIEEGWTKPSKMITDETLSPIEAIIIKASM
ncbi:Cloroperoxidase [Armillaria solidipes]|uniref:Cloroperoxidase n=1 Tax=Armillaria solidipes TaxID=1076256 RepID=A0A2H3BWF4_9AGAR|nr:Cloroperoxidase [Armillaria solidipes]